MRGIVDAIDGGVPFPLVKQPDEFRSRAVGSVSRHVGPLISPAEHVLCVAAYGSILSNRQMDTDNIFSTLWTHTFVALTRLCVGAGLVDAMKRLYIESEHYTTTAQWVLENYLLWTLDLSLAQPTESSIYPLFD